MFAIPLSLELEAAKEVFELVVCFMVKSLVFGSVFKYSFEDILCNSFALLASKFSASVLVFITLNPGRLGDVVIEGLFSLWHCVDSSSKSVCNVCFFLLFNEL